MMPQVAVGEMATTLGLRPLSGFHRPTSSDAHVPLVTAFTRQNVFEAMTKQAYAGNLSRYTAPPTDGPAPATDANRTSKRQVLLGRLRPLRLAPASARSSAKGQHDEPRSNSARTSTNTTRATELARPAQKPVVHAITSDTPQLPAVNTGGPIGAALLPSSDSAVAAAVSPATVNAVAAPSIPGPEHAIYELDSNPSRRNSDSPRAQPRPASDPLRPAHAVAAPRRPSADHAVRQHIRLEPGKTKYHRTTPSGGVWESRTMPRRSAEDDGELALLSAYAGTGQRPKSRLVICDPGPSNSDDFDELDLDLDLDLDFDGLPYIRTSGLGEAGGASNRARTGYRDDAYELQRVVQDASSAHDSSHWRSAYPASPVSPTSRSQTSAKGGAGSASTAAERKKNKRLRRSRHSGISSTSLPALVHTKSVNGESRPAGAAAAAAAGSTEYPPRSGPPPTRPLPATPESPGDKTPYSDRLDVPSHRGSLTGSMPSMPSMPSSPRTVATIMRFPKPPATVPLTPPPELALTAATAATASGATTSAHSKSMGSLVNGAPKAAMGARMQRREKVRERFSNDLREWHMGVKRSETRRRSSVESQGTLTGSEHAERTVDAAHSHSQTRAQARGRDDAGRTTATSYRSAFPEQAATTAVDAASYGRQHSSRSQRRLPSPPPPPPSLKPAAAAAASPKPRSLSVKPLRIGAANSYARQVQSECPSPTGTSATTTTSTVTAIPTRAVDGGTPSSTTANKSGAGKSTAPVSNMTRLRTSDASGSSSTVGKTRSGGGGGVHRSDAAAGRFEGIDGPEALVISDGDGDGEDEDGPSHHHRPWSGQSSQASQVSRASSKESELEMRLLELERRNAMLEEKLQRSARLEEQLNNNALLDALMAVLQQQQEQQTQQKSAFPFPTAAPPASASASAPAMSSGSTPAPATAAAIAPSRERREQHSEHSEHHQQQQQQQHQYDMRPQKPAQKQDADADEEQQQQQQRQPQQQSQQQRWSEQSAVSNMTSNTVSTNVSSASIGTNSSRKRRSMAPSPAAGAITGGAGASTGAGTGTGAGAGAGGGGGGGGSAPHHYRNHHHHHHQHHQHHHPSSPSPTAASAASASPLLDSWIAAAAPAPASSSSAVAPPHAPSVA